MQHVTCNRKQVLLLALAVTMAVFGVAKVFTSVTAQTQISPDAIAIRVIPNLTHFSAARWYQEKKLSGSPQSLTVDGYEAVRDERTVFVNAANVVNGNLYTNIYVISYNQEAESATTDIFSQILKHWKFNINLTGYGTCRQAALAKADNISCLSDEDCPISDHCTSMKARVTRDTNRLGDLADIKTVLEKYREQGFYPKLSSGTYLPNKTMSVWPSWRDEFGRVMGVNLPLDPVNRLGSCPGYNEVTCWDETSKSYALVYPEMPDDSLAYEYFSDAAGATGELCAVFESGLIITGAPISPPCAIVCLDFDNDGFCSPACGACALDCDDTDPSVNAPSGLEICGSGTDEDCDGVADCSDSDCTLDPACTVCVSNGCGGGCPSGCNVAQDPDCGCLTGDGCCNGLICDNASDADCPAICAPNGCGGGCPGGCGPADDPDCLGCSLTANGCCSAGCNIANDADCAPVCVDNDGDSFFDDNNQILCPGGNDCDDTISGSWIHPGAAEVCDGIDNDCNDGTADGSGEGVKFNTKQFGNCAGTRQRCVGVAWADDYSTAAGYQAEEDNPVNLCGDVIDNDCDSLTDAIDPDCAGTCLGLNVNESLWYVASVDPDCNQCDFDGDNDGDQGMSSTGRSWTVDYQGWADRCDSDCAAEGALVSASVQIDDFEMDGELACADGVDNDCDGNVDCADPQCAAVPACLASCADGSTVNTCSAISGPPWECNLLSILVDNCTRCGCTNPPAWVCGPAGTYCCNNECNGNCSNAGCVGIDPDCPAGTPCCGDGTCNGAETNITCAGDCLCDGTCNGVCSNAVCTVADDPDCPVGTACCGDGTCNGVETNGTCAGDCPVAICTFTFTFPCTFP